MGGFHLYLRAVGVAAAVGLLAPSCSCSDRIVGETPQGDGEPACVWLIAPRGTRPNGSTKPIIDHDNQRTGAACLCITQEDYDGLGDRLERVGAPESGTLLEEFNEIAYDECKRLSSIDPDDLVDDECLDYYEAGEWLKDIYFARGNWDHGPPPGFTCY